MAFLNKTQLKKFWRAYRRFAVAVFSLVLVDLVIVVVFSFYRPQIEKSDAIVVLGAAINTPALYNRSLEGLKLYEQGKAPVMVLSGGRINENFISEATSMQRAMQKNTQKSLNFILEEDSHSTYENLLNTRNKIGSGKSIVIVSDSFHLGRAVLLAKRLGFKNVAWSAPDSSYYSMSELSFYYMREVMAMLAYLPKFIFG